MWFSSQHNNTTTVPPQSSWRTSSGQTRASIIPQSGSPRTALVTGASSGIGCEISKMLADAGHNLVLVGRDRERLLGMAAELESRHGITVTPISRDLSLPDAATELLGELRQRAINIDILVNNAGFAIGGEFCSADVAQTISLLNVNVVALAHLTRLLLPGMISRRWGRVLNMASIAGMYPGPLTACYNASKAFVISFSLALSNELKGTGVTTTCICPGPTDTRFAERARLVGSKAFREHVMAPAEVARISYNAMMAGKTFVIAGVRNKLRMLAIPLVPSAVLAHFSKKYHEV